MRTPNSLKMGYLMVDHQASPGISPEAARRLGIAARPEGTVFEAKTLSCSHCRCSVVVNPDRTRDRHYCSKCDHYICDLCAFRAAQAGYVHKPYFAQAEDWMKALRPYNMLRGISAPPPPVLLLP